MHHTRTFEEFQKEQFEQFCKWQECDVLAPGIGKRKERARQTPSCREY